MRGMTRLMLSAALAGAGMAGIAAPAVGVPGDWGLDGTYTATSNGEWSKRNDVFHDEPSVRSVWTVTSTCSYPGECTGTVRSD